MLKALKPPLKRSLGYLRRPRILLMRIKYGFLDVCRTKVDINSVRLEADSRCQLKCPLCPTAQGLLRDRNIGWGYLRFRDFKNFVAEYPSIQQIELSNNGELFLNPELTEIIQHAYEKDIQLTAMNGANLNTVKDEVIEALAKYRFGALSVSLDGACNESYKTYRQRGNFDKVIENIRKINYYKRKYGTELPRLHWQFIIFGHNEHEVSIAHDMARELNMEFRPKLNAVPSYSHIKSEALDKKYRNPRPWPCSQLWFKPQINWDGKLLGCCRNYLGDFDFGNVFKDGLYECLNSEKYASAKEVALGLKEASDDLPCSKCPIYFESIRNKPSMKPAVLNRLARLSGTQA